MEKNEAEARGGRLLSGMASTEVTCDQRPEVGEGNHVFVLGEKLSKKRGQQVRSPEAEACFLLSRNRKRPV